MEELNIQCPNCGHTDAFCFLTDEEGAHYECPNCDHEWTDESLAIDEEE